MCVRAQCMLLWADCVWLAAYFIVTHDNSLCIVYGLAIRNLITEVTWIRKNDRTHTIDIGNAGIESEQANERDETNE